MRVGRSLVLALLVSAVFCWLASCGSADSHDFSLSFSAASLNLTGGQSAHVTVTASPVAKSTGIVAVALTGLPANVSADPMTFTVGIGSTQTVTFAASKDVASEEGTATATGTSGMNTHTASLPITVKAAAPPPDFSIAVSPQTLSFVAGTVSQPVAVSVTGANGFSNTVNVALSGLPAGVTATPASVTLTPGSAENVTFTAPATTGAEMGTVTFTGTSGSLSHAATLALAVTAVPPPPVTHDVVTYHYDAMRTGLNANETVLAPSNVNANSFGKVGFDATDGLVDAQPLYLSAVTMNATPHNVLYVATENDSVYAFDADNGAQLWKSSVLGASETPSDDHGCSQITPQIGITSTPVIDRKQGPNGAIYVVGMSKDANGGYHQRLHALDLTSGAEVLGGPTEISATYPGTGATSSNGVNTFDPAQYAERAALLLLNGTIYLSWTSHCDFQPYSGWIMAYSQTTLQQTAVLNLTPNGAEGSIWMSGGGPAADSGGNIYLLEANGTFDGTLDANGFPSSQDYGNSFLKLSTANGKIAVADYFQPVNGIQESSTDTDLGSGEAMVLPDIAGPNNTRLHLAVGAGKDSHIYFVNRDNMGKYSPTANNVYADLPGIFTQGVFSSPAYFNGTIYIGGVGNSVQAFPVSPPQTSGAPVPATPSSVTGTIFQYPGASPSVSANGTQNAILWALESTPGNPAVLHAYDATNLATEFYNSNQAPNGRDSFGNGNKFITPMVANGKVYVGTPTGVAVFGELTP